MGYTCCVPYCKTGYKSCKNLETPCLFSFPSDVHLRQKWITAISRKDFKPMSSHRICSKHFFPEDIWKTSRDTKSKRRKRRKTEKLTRARLKSGAVPSIFSYFKCKSKTPSVCTASQSSSCRVNEKTSSIIHSHSEEQTCVWPSETMQRKSVVSSPTKSSVLVCSETKALAHVEVDNTTVEKVQHIWTCCVPLCNNNSKQHPHLCFHKLPKFVKPFQEHSFVNWRYKKWKSWLEMVFHRCGVSKKLISDDVRVCSVHFEDSDFSVKPKIGLPRLRVTLLDTSVPSVFSPTLTKLFVQPFIIGGDNSGYFHARNLSPIASRYYEKVCEDDHNIEAPLKFINVKKLQANGICYRHFVVNFSRAKRQTSRRRHNYCNEIEKENKNLNNSNIKL